MINQHILMHIEIVLLIFHGAETSLLEIISMAVTVLPVQMNVNTVY